MAIDEQPVTRAGGGRAVSDDLDVLSDRGPQAGILDYDINYFDASDLSWQAEDDAIRRAGVMFDGIPAEIQIHNEARVHLWYEEKSGVAD